MVTSLMYEALFANLFASVSLSDPPVHLVVAPLTHAVGTISLAACAWGGANVILADTDTDTDTGAILAAIERYRVSLLFLLSMAIYRLLAHPDLRRNDYSALWQFIYAAAPMSLDKLGSCIEVFGPVMVQAYGQAEAPFFCTCLTTEDHRAVSDLALRKRLSTCGRVTPFMVVEIMDDEGRLLGPGETGEIVVCRANS
jgi:acyl-CoA synthetase (AMP-forming)/AMP-acid ligase II